MDAFRELYDAQAGVVRRDQLLTLGATDNDLRRLVRRKELVRVHTGVFVNHTGPLSWTSRAWAAVLFHEPSALCDVSALNLAGDLVHVAVEWPRTGTVLPGVRLHRLRHLSGRVQWNLGPPRLRVDEAALDVAGRAPTFSEAVAVLTGVCQRRRTTPERLLRALDGRQRMPRGSELRRVVVDVASGVHSVLERSYVHRVERRHGLPRGSRQMRERQAGGVIYRDVGYDALRLVVELDGYGWHSAPFDRAKDMTRDLVAAADGLLTVRLGWRHAHEDACVTAGRLARVMQERGWRGSPRPCGSGCLLRVDFQALGT